MNKRRPTPVPSQGRGVDTTQNIPLPSLGRGRGWVFFFLYFFLFLPAFPQTKKIEDLKSQRGELQAQIKQSETLLLSTKKDVKSQLDDLALINSRLSERRKYIAAIEQEMAALDGDIARLGRETKRLEGELREKQERYASSVRYLHKNRSIEEKLMFILSAESLNQAYRRLRYVNEYATYQRVQGEQIKQKQLQVEQKRQEVLAAKEEKARLLADREAERTEMEKQEKLQRALVDKLQKKQRNLQAELKKQRQKQQKLNAQIDRLIEQEIAAAKKREQEAERKRKAAAAKKKGSGASSATSPSGDKKEPDLRESLEADRQLSGSFESNRGKLPIPITGPYAVVSHFGQYNVEGLKNVRLDNKGIDIKGQRGAGARAVFDGEVTAVFQSGGTTGVLVRHGSYISVYCNLSSTVVKRGQKLKTRDLIGTVATDASGSTILHFQLHKERTKLNPEKWLGR